MECVFAEECPEIELKAGMVFITSKQGDRKVAMSPATLAEFIVVATGTLKRFYAKETVVPLRPHGQAATGRSSK